MFRIKGVGHNLPRGSPRPSRSLLGILGHPLVPHGRTRCRPSRAWECLGGHFYVFAKLWGPFFDPFWSPSGSLFGHRCEPQVGVTSRHPFGSILGASRNHQGASEHVNTMVNSMSPFSLPGSSRAAPGTVLGARASTSRAPLGAQSEADFQVPKIGARFRHGGGQVLAREAPVSH